MKIRAGSMVVGFFLLAGIGQAAAQQALDLSITKTDGMTTVAPGDELIYTIIVFNHANPTVATVVDTLDPMLTNATWTCIGQVGFAACDGVGGALNSSGSGNINQVVALGGNGSLTFTLTATLDPAAFGTISNTAIVISVFDINPANNTATDTDAIGTAVAVPEPATLALLGVGIAGLGFARRRKLN